MAKDTLRLDKALCHNFDVPRTYAAKLIKAGLVEVDGEVNQDFMTNHNIFIREK